ncbi:MAG: 5-oxoprolinase subunit PxpB [Pseudomonadota bacterium]
MPVRIADDVFSIAVPDANAAQTLAARLRQAVGLDEIVAGLDSVCVQFDPGLMPSEQAMSMIEDALRSCASAEVEGTRAVIEIPVWYGGEHGPDLAHVCETVGLSESQFIERHKAPDYAVEMIGFTPGFAYLGGLQEALSVPRLGTPRVRVPAGSIGVSGLYCGLYAMAGPGGWPIIGRTDAAVFDASKPDPFLLHPGRKVRFVNP